MDSFETAHLKRLYSMLIHNWGVGENVGSVLRGYCLISIGCLSDRSKRTLLAGIRRIIGSLLMVARKQTCLFPTCLIQVALCSSMNVDQQHDGVGARNVKFLC